MSDMDIQQCGIALLKETVKPAFFVCVVIYKRLSRNLIQQCYYLFSGFGIGMYRQYSFSKIVRKAHISAIEIHDFKAVDM